MKLNNRSPIGVFDSGLGGLTVVREIMKQLPHEDLIYVGDTARVPYGTKSPHIIKRYAMQISFFLIQKKVKAIVVACNSASAVALKDLGNLPLPVVGVIEPGARAAALQTENMRIGVVGTKITVGSHAYKKAIKHYSARAKVWEQACPLFVPLVEEGWLDHPVTKRVAEEYLKGVLHNGIDSLVLGCTHYPLLKPLLKSIVGKKVKLIDSAEETASEVVSGLSEASLTNNKRSPGRAEYYVTDMPSSFHSLGRKFLGQQISPAKHLPFETL